MAAAATTISPDIDFGSRLAAFRAVATAMNANFAYWNKTALRGTVPDQTAANSLRRLTGMLNSLIAANAATMTGFSMANPPVSYLSSDYHDFQSILSGIITQHNAIVTAHP